MPLWYIEFRSFSSWDYFTPLMYLPVQRTNVRAGSAEDARNEVLSWRAPGGRIDVISCELAPEWMQKDSDATLP